MLLHLNNPCNKFLASIAAETSFKNENDKISLDSIATNTFLKEDVFDYFVNLSKKQIEFINFVFCDVKFSPVQHDTVMHNMHYVHRELLTK